MNYDVKTKILVLVLLVLAFLLPFFSAQNFSPSSDEITHLPSGYSYWKTGQITLNPQHPPFVKLISAFPLLFMDLKFDIQDPTLSGPFKNEWEFGKKLLVNNNTDKLLLWGRLAPMFISVLLAFFIFKWSSEMFNVKAGLLSLFLYVFMPNIIAHAQFVTTDLALTSFSFVVFYYLWKFFSAEGGSASGGKIKNKKYLIYSGFFFGLALSSKFSAVLFLPVIFFLILVYVRSGKNDFHATISRLVRITVVMIAPAFLVVYFSYLMPTDTGFYLKGLRTIYADSNTSYSFYLNGQFSKDGWWYYFLEAFLIKTPIPVLIALAAALIFYKKIIINSRDRLFIFLPLIFFFIVTSFKAHDIGVRYLLPAFPFMILYTGGLAIPLEVSLATKSRVRRTLARLLLTGLGLWYIFSSVSIFPDYLAYFNEFAGGPANGYKYLDDSNLEWRHDLKRFAEYQRKHSDVKLVYSDKNIYFDPSYYGIKNIIPPTDELISKMSGKYAININFLVRLKELSQRLNDKKLDWLSSYKSIDRVGYSFLIYEFK